MHFQQDAAVFRLEGSVVHTGRPHGVSVAFKFFTALALFIIADDQVARDKKHFFPIFVHERLGGVDAGSEAQKKAIDRWGGGMASVRFICGTEELHKELQALLRTSDDRGLLDKPGGCGTRGTSSARERCRCAMV